MLEDKIFGKSRSTNSHSFSIYVLVRLCVQRSRPHQNARENFCTHCCHPRRQHAGTHSRSTNVCPGGRISLSHRERIWNSHGRVHETVGMRHVRSPHEGVPGVHSHPHSSHSHPRRRCCRGRGSRSRNCCCCCCWWPCAPAPSCCCCRCCPRWLIASLVMPPVVGEANARHTWFRITHTWFRITGSCYCRRMEICYLPRFEESIRGGGRVVYTKSRAMVLQIKRKGWTMLLAFSLRVSRGVAAPAAPSPPRFDAE